MLADTLHSSWAERSRRRWTTLTSFGLQALVTGILLLLPLLRPMGLPTFRQLTAPISLGQPLGEPPAHVRTGGTMVAPSTSPVIFLRQPASIPHDLSPASDDGPPSIGWSTPSTPGGPGPGGPVGVLNSPGTGVPVLPVPPKPAAVAPIRVSSISEGNLTRKVQPAYPPLARSARIQGMVVLQAVISREGTIKDLKVLTGHPMLVGAAVDAVRQWRYRPYVLNHEPVEVETQITVDFSLTGN
ncbi:MAG: energy transducer TonB [Candidatus Sulfotelmatobacter sp.]